jgi:hypothetical protein
MKLEKNVFRNSIYLFILLAVTIACSDPDINPNPSSNDHLVYVAFNESANDIWVAKYLDPNGSIVKLSDGKKDTQANSIVVDGDDVYFSGYAQNSKNQMYALYWKNSNPILLTDTTLNATTVAEDIFILNHDVYVTGYQNSEGGTRAVYWKNGVIIKLGDNQSDSYGYSIFVSGNDVYVAGTSKNKISNIWQALYWKNGEEVKLSGTAASSIFVVENDVYVSGGFDKTPQYYKNGLPILLNETRNMGTSDIVVDGENVYVSSPGMYWNNDTKISLADKGIEPNVFALYALDQQVYVCGSIRNGQKYIARYWKNGEAVNITDGTTFAAASSIFAVRDHN